ncbi:MAG: phosphate ABC transporter ATP-binding protein PstB [Gemmatimonadota bacterium]|nr:phosphate ABC transporter ATP-binding protein PstB [Gemmatimonadota bacterium]MDH5197683.1 phosphate ABC transporter ATP-binding protein PstB [Gemmatimonadota bacterium]
MSAGVEIRDFSFWYGKTQALRNITIPVNPGRITAFIGPSGCGKSTLLRSINRMNELITDTRHAGDIQVSGGSVYAPSVDVVALRRQIGMVFQKPNPFPKSIFDNVAYGPRVNALAGEAELADRVERALKRAALWDEVADRLDNLGTGLSGGQQQRLCIARALANEPDILLLDEPCSALDPIATQRVEELLVELKREVTIVIVTHNLHQAARIADDTAFFYLGELIEFGTSDELFTRPREKRTEAYVTGRFG